MEEPRPIVTAAIVLFCCAVLAAIAIPNVVHDPETSPTNACINNLRLLDAAKQMWALEHNKTNSDTPTWGDLKPYLCSTNNLALSECPSGGTYTLSSVSNPPTCSIPGHVLP
jgi:competence protein ComGC